MSSEEEKKNISSSSGGHFVAEPQPSTSAGQSDQMNLSSHYSPHVEQSGGSLYIGNLAHLGITKPMIGRRFSRFGPIVSIVLYTSRGYAYVNFQRYEDAERAYKTMMKTNLYIMNRRVYCMWSPNDPSISLKTNLGIILLKNLNYSVGTSVLFDLCSSFGEVLTVRVPYDDNGCTKGYGFVYFSNRDAAILAVPLLNGIMLHNKRIFVKHALPLSEMAPGSRTHINKTLYVKNFPSVYRDEDLKRLFGKFGTLVSYHVVLDCIGRSRGFGFVEFQYLESCQAAIDAMNGKVKLGLEYPLFVQYSQTREQRQKVVKDCMIIVDNFDETVSRARLYAKFMQCGQISSTKMQITTDKRRASICFVSPESAKKAVETMNNVLLDTKLIKVSYAFERQGRSE